MKGFIEKMENEEKKTVALNFSEKYILGTLTRDSKKHNSYKNYLIGIPDDDYWKREYKRAFEIPIWKVLDDKYSESRKLTYLELGRTISTREVKLDPETKEIKVKEDSMRLIMPDELIEIFKRNDRRIRETEKLSDLFTPVQEEKKDGR